MRIVAQRVRRASVDVEGSRIAEIGPGLLLLIGIAPGDERIDLGKVAKKVVELRIFADEEGKMNLSVLEAGGSVLAVSQFTLYADTRKGRRPSFVGAAPPEVAEPVFDALVGAIASRGIRVETGRFGARMAVELTNDGPVTLVIEVDPTSP